MPYIIKAESCTKDENGNITEIQCTYDPLSRSGSGTPESMRRVKGTLHWVSIKHAVEAEVRIYDRLFLDEAPDSHKDKDFYGILEFEFVRDDHCLCGTKFAIGYYWRSFSVSAKRIFQY